MNNTIIVTEIQTTQDDIRLSRRHSNIKRLNYIHTLQHSVITLPSRLSRARLEYQCHLNYIRTVYDGDWHSQWTEQTQVFSDWRARVYRYTGIQQSARRTMQHDRPRADDLRRYDTGNSPLSPMT